jgi:hypothetical protein
MVLFAVGAKLMYDGYKLRHPSQSSRPKYIGVPQYPCMNRDDSPAARAKRLRDWEKELKEITKLRNEIGERYKFFPIWDLSLSDEENRAHAEEVKARERAASPEEKRRLLKKYADESLQLDYRTNQLYIHMG